MDIHRLVEQAVSGLGYEFVDVESSPRGRLVRVFIDAPEGAGGGVTVEDCARVSHHLTRLFEVENVDYDRLEVSSPGLDRLLRKPADFVRFSGHDARLRMRVPIDGQRNFVGVLSGVEDGKVKLQSEGGCRTLDLAQIEKARLVPKY